MRKIFLTFVLGFILVGGAYADCCPAPYCKDGTGGAFCCGKGPNDWWRWFDGCAITCCACNNGCREPQNIDQCYKYCQNVEYGCENICSGNPWAEAICDQKCESQQGVCNEWCDGEFP